MNANAKRYESFLFSIYVPYTSFHSQAIFEFIATEAAYVRDLQLIVEVFYSNLLSILDEKGITVVFANVEDILLTNTVRILPDHQQFKTLS